MKSWKAFTTVVNSFAIQCVKNSGIKRLSNTENSIVRKCIEPSSLYHVDHSYKTDWSLPVQFTQQELLRLGLQLQQPQQRRRQLLQSWFE
jgi:hypothetical protein